MQQRTIQVHRVAWTAMNKLYKNFMITTDDDILVQISQTGDQKHNISVGSLSSRGLSEADLLPSSWLELLIVMGHTKQQVEMVIEMVRR